MPSDDSLTDEYVAELLAADAKQRNIKYSAMGLEAFAPSRSAANKPKPNTRFLRNIIKDTDSHNAALLAKEAAESKARLRELSKNGGRAERTRPMSGGDIRKRQLGDIAAILGGGGVKKRRRVEDDRRDGRDKTVSPGATRSRSREERKDRSKQRDGSPEQRRRHRDRKDEPSSEKRRDRDRGRDHKDRDRSRSRSPKRERRHDERRHRERSPRRRSRGPGDDSKHSSRTHRRRSLERYDPKEKHTPRAQSPKREVEDDSDPLDDIIGPKPPPIVRSRGRGAVSAASGMDARFAKGYDPSADVQLDLDEENDWEQALEALRDRQKWKQQGADRLRAAGFTEDEVKKWETGGEKREEDVKWAKKGEGREWDRGKVMGDDGQVVFDPSYGRLTDD